MPPLSARSSLEALAGTRTMLDSFRGVIGDLGMWEQRRRRRGRWWWLSAGHVDRDRDSDFGIAAADYHVFADGQLTPAELRTRIEVRPGLWPSHRLFGSYCSISRLGCFLDWAANYYPEAGVWPVILRRFGQDGCLSRDFVLMIDWPIHRPRC